PAARGPEILRQVSEPNSVRHRRRALRERDAPADFRRTALRNLFPFPRNRRRIFRLRPRADPAAGTLEDLRAGIAGEHSEESLLRKCGEVVGADLVSNSHLRAVTRHQFFEEPLVVKIRRIVMRPYLFE